MKSLAPIILIAASGAIFFFFTNTVYQDIKTINLEKADYDTALNKSREVLKKRSELAEQYKKFTEEDLVSIQKLLPDHVDNIQLVLDMNGIAKEKGITLRGIKINEEKVSKDAAIGPDRKPYASILVSFKVTSSYENFVAFIKDIEQSLRLVDITALSFKASDSGVYDYNVTIKTYWLKQ